MSHIVYTKPYKCTLHKGEIATLRQKTAKPCTCVYLVSCLMSRAYYPSVKVPSISMENGGVLERAKMGISIYGEKE